MKWMISIVVVLCSQVVFSQEDRQEQKTEEELKSTHRITLGLGHTHLAKGKNIDGEKVWMTVPSWSFNYDYWIANKWAIGLQTDLVIDNFVVENQDGDEIEREKPFAVVPVGIFKPFKHFSLFLGTGVELEKTENMWLTRLGAEFGCDLSEGWEAGIAAMWDNKWGNYNSWVLEFSFSKKFSKRK